MRKLPDPMKFVDKNDILTPNHYDLVIKDSYWAVTEDDKVLCYGESSWQHNTNIKILEKIQWEGTHPEFIPLAYVPIPKGGFC